MTARTRLSVSNCRAILPRAAPSAVRTHISALRAMPRTRRRFAILAHAISNTSPEIHISKCKCEAYSFRMASIPAPPGSNQVYSRQLCFFFRRGKRCGWARAPAAAARSASPVVGAATRPASRGRSCKATWRLGRVRREHSPVPASTQSGDKNPGACSTSGRRRKPSGAIPAIVTGLVFTKNVLPMTAGSLA